MGAEHVQYIVNSGFKIIDANDAWRSFYAENGDDKSPTAFVGENLFHHIASADVQDIYLRIFNYVRSTQRAVHFPFQCNSPALMREMQMSITPLYTDGFVLECELLRATPLPDGLPQEPLPGVIKICSWCNRILVGAHWLQIPDAIQAHHIFSRMSSPAIQHGICPECRAKFIL